MQDASGSCLYFPESNEHEEVDLVGLQNLVKGGALATGKHHFSVAIAVCNVCIHCIENFACYSECPWSAASMCVGIQRPVGHVPSVDEFPWKEPTPVSEDTGEQPSTSGRTTSDCKSDDAASHQVMSKDDTGGVQTSTRL